MLVPVFVYQLLDLQRRGLSKTEYTRRPFLPQRSYHVGGTGSRPITAVKQPGGVVSTSMGDDLSTPRIGGVIFCCVSLEGVAP